MAQNSWQGKICPFLSAGTVRPAAEPSKLVQLNTPAASKEQTLEVLPCQGPQCMLFMHLLDEKGQPTDGACSLALSTKGISDLVMLANGLALRSLSAQSDPNQSAIKSKG